MSGIHPYQHAIDTINRIGLYKAKEGQKPYRLLHKLAKSLGVYMHGSEAFIGSSFNIPRKRMSRMAADALKMYGDSGILAIPDQFKYNENRIYRHDGDSSANRNIWKESNKCKRGPRKTTPVHYSFNTGPR